MASEEELRQRWEEAELRRKWEEAQRTSLAADTATPIPSVAKATIPDSEYEGKYGGGSTDLGSLAHFGLSTAGMLLFPEVLGTEGLLSSLAGKTLLQRGGGYLVDSLLGALGAKGGDIAAQELGMTPETTARQDLGDIGINTLIGAIPPSLADSFVTGRKYLSSTYRDWREAQIPGITGARLNIPKGTTSEDDALFEKLKKNEDTFLKMNLMEGIDPESDVAGNLLAERITTRKNALNTQKTDILDETKRAMQAANDPGRVITLDEVLATAKAKNKELSANDLAQIEKILDENFKVTQYKNVYGEVIPESEAASYGYGSPENIGEALVKKQTIAQPMDIVGLEGFKSKMDDEIAQLKGYNTRGSSNQTSLTQPSVQANIYQNTDPYYLVRETAKNKINTLAEQATGKPLGEINRQLQTLMDYEKATKLFNTQTAQGFAPGSSRSLLNKVESPAQTLSGIGGMATLGAYTTLRDSMKREAAISRGGNMVQQLQDIQRFRGAPEPSLGKGSNVAQFASDIPPSVYQLMGGANTARAEDEIAAPVALPTPGAEAGINALQAITENMPPQAATATPDILKAPLDPTPPIPNVAVLPRTISELKPKDVFDIIPRLAAPQDVMPLRIQFQKIMASGDKKQVAQFLSALSVKYPDLPLERGVVTGKPSEFDLGDGRRILVDEADKSAWLDEISRSSLRADEKAQRVRALLTDGTVYPMSVKLNNFDAETQPPMTPDDLALRNIQQSMVFSPRQQGAHGTSIRME